MMKATANEKGFTLIELLATMVILSVLISVGFKKVDTISSASEQTMLTQGIMELNTRESLTWFQVKLSHPGYGGDEFYGQVWISISVRVIFGRWHPHDPAEHLNSVVRHHLSSERIQRMIGQANGHFSPHISCL